MNLIRASEQKAVPPVSPAGSRRCLLYLLDRFPADTLNFVYNEIRCLEESGFQVAIWSLLPCRHCPDEARPFRERTRNVRPAPAGRVLSAWMHYLLRRPLPLLALLLRLPLDNDTPIKAARALGHLVIAVYFAWLVRDHDKHIHAHFAHKASLTALVAARLNGITYSFTAHGSATLRAPLRVSLRSKLRDAAFIVAVSEYNRQVIERLSPELPRERVFINRTGILLEQFPFHARDARRPGPYRLICVASLFPVKNHEGLLRSCAILAEQGLDFRLDLLGKDSGDRRERLETLALALGIAGSVDFHGVVDHGEVARYLREADLFVLASHSEGVPVSVMEAMAMGTPVLGPRVTGLPELIEEGVSGLLADPRRPEEFAERMARLLDDPERAAAMARNARARIERDYDMRANARALARLFAERLGGAGA